MIEAKETELHQEDVYFFFQPHHFVEGYTGVFFEKLSHFVAKTFENL